MSTSFKCKHGCGRAPAINRLECYNCRSKFIREKKPIDVCYYNLKKSAKKRFIVFTITLDWFRAWIKNTGYMENKGRLCDNLTIDRIENWRGYEADNLAVITKSENSSKYHNIDVLSGLGPQFESEILPF